MAPWRVEWKSKSEMAPPVNGPSPAARARATVYRVGPRGRDGARDRDVRQGRQVVQGPAAGVHVLRQLAVADPLELPGDPLRVGALRGVHRLIAQRRQHARRELGVAGFRRGLLVCCLQLLFGRAHAAHPSLGAVRGRFSG